MRNLYFKLKSQTRGMFTLILCMATMLCAAQGFAQQKVTGKVVDNGGQPVIGATIMVKGTSIGTTTGADGTYSINAAGPKSTLVFSFIGYETVEETVGAKKAIDVTLPESAIAIESVVSIGYGVKKKTDLTGSITSIETDALVAKGTTSVMEALQGQIPGVTISQKSTKAGSGFSIQIRGQNSMKAADPLYVVDGIVVDDINFLNPSDIERIDVMKDASSNAIYGSRGSNGVIQVITKQAAGAKKDRFSLSYDGYYGIKETVRMPEMMNGDQFMEYRMAAYVTRTLDKVTNEAKYSIPTTANMQTSLVSPLVVNRYINKDYYDWIGKGFQNGSQQNHFVSINGSSGNTSYVLGLGYQNEQGSFDNDTYDRVNLRGGFTTKIKDFATIGFQSNLSFTEVEAGAANALRDIQRMNPVSFPYDENGELIPMPMSAPALKSLDTGGAQFSSQYNPLLDLQNTTNNTRRMYLLTNVFAEIEPIKNLKIKTQFSPNIRNSRNGQYQGIMTSDRNSKGTDWASIQKRDYLEYTWDNSIFWSGSTGDHQYDATGVYSIYQTRYEDSYNEVENLSVPGFYNLASASTQLKQTSDFRMSTMMSFIARLNYTYKGKYLITASYRSDGSSKLADKWASFPSVAAGWRISEEPWMKEADWLSNLKLRASYGFTGNNNIDPYATQTLANKKYWYGFGSANDLALGMGPNGIANTDLTWEKTRELNIGLDFGFLNGRISGSIDWYDKLSDGLLMDRLLPVETGITGAKVTDNIGSVGNRGIEIGLSTINIKKKNVMWTTNFSFSMNKNSIKSLYGEKKDDLSNRWFIGQPINVAYQYVYDGVVSAAEAKTDYIKKLEIWEGAAKVKDLSGPNGVPDGVISSLDRTITGSAFPDWIGNFSSSLKVYNFDFSFNIYASIGSYVKSPFLAEALNIGERARGKAVKGNFYMAENIGFPVYPTWVTETTNHKFSIPSNTSGTNPMPYQTGPYWNVSSDDYQNGWTDASFVKVKNISLGYTFPNKITQKLRMQNLRVYVNVLNPFVFADKDFIGYDPEWAGSPIAYDSKRPDSMGGPASMIWQFGLNVKF